MCTFGLVHDPRTACLTDSGPRQDTDYTYTRTAYCFFKFVIFFFVIYKLSLLLGVTVLSLPLQTKVGVRVLRDFGVHTRINRMLCVCVCNDYDDGRVRYLVYYDEYTYHF